MTLAQDITRHYGGDWHGSYGAIPAPGHNKHDRGVTVKDTESGDVLFNSFNGADWRALKDECRAKGLLPDRKRANDNCNGPRQTGHYEYTDAAGAVLYRTVRIEQAGKRKRFTAQRPNGRGGWIDGMGDVQRVLYRLPDIIGADPAQPVYLVEGERKADKLASWGITATAVAFGCKGWRKEYVDALTGRMVIILPDNDDVGRDFAQRAAQDIETAGCKVRIVDLPGLPAGGDIMDWTGTADDLRALVEKAGKTGGLPGLPGLCGPETWEGTKAPNREWIFDDWLVCGSAGLLGGEEGVGKSLAAQQMATCGAAGIPFLGMHGQRVRAIYITCEDDQNELQRRQENINASLGLSMSDLKGWLRTFSLKGEIGNELSEQDEKGVTVPTQRYNQVRQAVLEFGARLVFIDNAAHVFPGNENNRHEVAAFLGLLERLSIEINGAVVLLAHPNKQHSQGNKQGNEYSGTTGWSAHVRNRLFIDWEDGDMPNPDGHVLRRSKSNYSAKGEEISFIWRKWAFARMDDLPPDIGAEVREIARCNAANAAFLACLDLRNEQERPVSESPASRTYAPKEFATMPEAKGCKKEQLEAAMDRLFRTGEIEIGMVCRTGRKDRFGIRRKCADLCADPAPTGCADPALTPRRPALSHTLISKDIMGGALGAPAPRHEKEGGPGLPPASFPADENDGLDENGDIIGWKDGGPSW